MVVWGVQLWSGWLRCSEPQVLQRQLYLDFMRFKRLGEVLHEFVALTRGHLCNGIGDVMTRLALED